MTAEAFAKVAVDRPLPVPDAATGPYWEAARTERLVMPRCDDCGRYHFYPRTLCPQCSSATRDARHRAARRGRTSSR